MVLHHVTQGTGGLVKRATLFHPQLLGDRDLDIGNRLAPPEWLKQGIAKALLYQGPTVAVAASLAVLNLKEVVQCVIGCFSSNEHNESCPPFIFTIDMGQG